MLDLVFPRSCSHCGDVLADDDVSWCPACLARLLSATAADYCPRCGRTCDLELQTQDGCPACRRGPRSLDGIARVGGYDTIVGSVIKRYKYSNEQHLDKPLADLLAASVGGRPWRERLNGIVPVPTTFSSRLHYKFQPVHQLAKLVARAQRRPLLPVLRVSGKKRRQVELPATARLQNVRGVFRIHPQADVAGAVLCVLDDVTTTGATLQEVARVLKQAGAAEVYGAVIAKANPEHVANSGH